MTVDDRETTARTDPQTLSGRLGNLAAAVVVAGVALAVVGVIVGIVVAAHDTVVECPGGTYFPEGTTDFRCYSYPHAGEGVSVAVLAAMLGIVIVLLGMLLAATRRGASDRSQ